MQQKESPTDIQCKDKFLVQSVIASPGATAKDITANMFNKEEGQNLSPNTTRIYQISGTQKFELPKHEIKITNVFQAVENAKSRFTVYAWALADTTLEDVFIKVARGAQTFVIQPTVSPVDEYGAIVYAGRWGIHGINEFQHLPSLNNFLRRIINSISPCN